VPAASHALRAAGEALEELPIFNYGYLASAIYANLWHLAKIVLRGAIVSMDKKIAYKDFTKRLKLLIGKNPLYDEKHLRCNILIFDDDEAKKQMARITYTEEGY
jgi:hypothetical protein